MLAVDRLQPDPRASARHPITNSRVQLPMRWGCVGGSRRVSRSSLRVRVASSPVPLCRPTALRVAPARPASWRRRGHAIPHRNVLPPPPTSSGRSALGFAAPALRSGLLLRPRPPQRSGCRLQCSALAARAQTPLRGGHVHSITASSGLCPRFSRFTSILASPPPTSRYWRLSATCE